MKLVSIDRADGYEMIIREGNLDDLRLSLNSLIEKHKAAGFTVNRLADDFFEIKTYPFYKTLSID